MRKRKHIKKNCGSPPSVVLALPAHTAVDMRIRKWLKLEMEKKETVTSPSHEDNTAVDQSQCSEHVPEIHSTLKIKKTSMSRKRNSNVIECDNDAGMLTDETLLVGSSSTFPTGDIESTPVSVVAPSSKRNNSKKAVQSEISEDVNEAINECKVLTSSQAERADIPPKHETGCDGSASTGIKKYGRRKKKVRSSSKIDPNFTQEETCSIGLLGQSGSDDALLGVSGKTLSDKCPKDVDEKVLVQGQGSPIQVAGDVRMEKVIDDSALVDENEGSVAVNNATEKVTEGCFSKHKGSVTNSEEIIQQPERVDLNDVSPEAGESKFFPEDASQGEGNMLSPGRSLVTRKKLLVLDLNGLIADIIRYVPERHTPDKVIAMKAVFKRPFYEDFLQFCFARFNVGVWSSRAKSNVRSVVDFLLGDTKQNLLFCWDQSHCTQTGFYTVENRQKPLIAKKLKKLWEKHEPDLPWELGEYNETNTLMLDDSPYKALFNPPHTAIFPPTYTYKDKNDNSLGPGGALRIYLEELASAADVQEFVKEHPFGQRPITENNASWRFYQKVLETGLITPEKAPSKFSIDEPEERQEITDNQVDLESYTEPPEQKARDSPSRQVLLDTDTPDQRSGEEKREESEQVMQTDKPVGKQTGTKNGKGNLDSGNKALDLPVEIRERRANRSPSRHILHDSERPRQKRREVESEHGIRNAEPVGGQHGIQSGEGDCAPAIKTFDELHEQKTSGSPRWNMMRDSGRPHERRVFERKEEGGQKVQNRELVGLQGIQSGKGDFGSANKPLHSRPESRERRASGSPRRLMLDNTDRLHKRRGFERREESEQQGLRHNEPIGGRGRGQAMQCGKRAFDYANKNTDSRAESRERRNMFFDSNRPQWRWGVDRREEREPGIQSGKGDLNYINNNMDSHAISREQRNSGSPRRHTLRDTDRPLWKRGVERREGERNSDYNLPRTSNFIRYDDADNANRQDYGRKMQRWGGDWNQPYRGTNKHPEDQMPDGDSHEYSSYDIRSSVWSTGRGSDWSRGRDSDWSRERGPDSDWSRERGPDSDWNRERGPDSDWSRERCPDSDWSSERGSNWGRERGSGWNNGGRGSGWNNRGRGSDWNNRGRGSEWNNRASQESEKRPVPYDPKGSHHSSGFTSYYSQRAAEKSRGILGPGGRGDCKQRPYQPIDQRPVSMDRRAGGFSMDRRMGGFSYNNRYSTPSFHWQAYR